MAIFVIYCGPIDFKIGLYIKVKVNEGQKQFEDHISNRLAKMARCHFGA